MTDAPAKQVPTCCGKDSWTTAGAEPVTSCQLCPASPTYWRKTRTVREQDALGYRIEVPGDR